jgi:hypothetical protein
MSIKITIPNTSSDVLTFGSANTPTAAQIAGIDSGSSNGQLALYTTASGTSTERVRVNASGNVGIGTSSPNLNGFNKELTVSAGTSGTARAGINIQGSRTTDSTFGALSYYHQANLVGSIEMIRGGADNSGAMQFFTANAGTTAERARINSSGNLLVGTTSAGQDTRIVVKGAGSVNWSVGPDNSTGNVFYVLNTGGTGVGLTTGNTSWSTASDERIKDIIEPITDAINKVSTLRAVIGKYKTDEEGIRRSFLIAQDVQSVLPEVIDTDTDEQGTMSIRYTEVIPLLVAAIKEQSQLITQLQADVAALKGASA